MENNAQEIIDSCDASSGFFEGITVMEIPEINLEHHQELLGTETMDLSKFELKL